MSNPIPILIKSKHIKKKYHIIPYEMRKEFIERVKTKSCTIKQAAFEFGLNVSTSKAILKIYRKEGRIGKKLTRNTQAVKKLMPTQEIIQNLKKEESDIEKKNESQIKEEFSNHEKFNFDLNIKFHENNFKNNCYIYQRNFQQFNFYQALALRFNCNFPKFETSSFPSIINFPGLNNQLIRQIVNPYYNNSFFQSQFLFHS